ncbi:hypothetical protein BDN72DRAFT_850390 [Pluteus cervinus]|uniref:Uncharacterized protein n=1 Tax=Pluteus cervinus TaxID=181527 RepID=A0ACD3A406_9AGAR|nr:hypothetical protein BDN72DRAFT_850390 [Pluteus cervinus]
MSFSFPATSQPASSPKSRRSSELESVIPPGSAVRAITSLLRVLLRVTITDGRVFLGTFAGTDQPMNILLLNTEEYRMSLPSLKSTLSESELELLALEKEARSDGRYVGQILIPWRMVVKVEAQNA